MADGAVPPSVGVPGRCRGAALALPWSPEPLVSSGRLCLAAGVWRPARPLSGRAALEGDANAAAGRTGTTGRAPGRQRGSLDHVATSRGRVERLAAAGFVRPHPPRAPADPGQSGRPARGPA